MQGTNANKHWLYTHNAWTRKLISKTYNFLTKKAMYLRPTGGKTKQLNLSDIEEEKGRDEYTYTLRE